MSLVTIGAGWQLFADTAFIQLRTRDQSVGAG